MPTGLYIPLEKMYICFPITKPGEFQSGQMGQTVNLLAFAFGGSNPSSPTLIQRWT